jgi:hypothetical protein
MNANEIQFEKYWRNKIALEVEQLIQSVPQISGEDILIKMKEKIYDLYKTFYVLMIFYWCLNVVVLSLVIQ